MSLENDGYIIIKNNFNKNLIDNVKEHITKSSVDYSVIDSFIRNDMMKNVNKNMNWDTHYTKYRVSNNNNSTDAAVFHRDLIYYTEAYPIFTCLIYLDDTIMEVIPGSHNKIAMSYSELLSLKPEQIKLGSGDILLFYSSLIHRGIFTENIGDRKLIQVFEVYKNKNDFNNYKDEILHIPADVNNNTDMVRSILIGISKIKFLINFFSYIILINVATGYGYKNNTSDDGFKIFSSESRQDRYYDINKVGPINKYIMLHETYDTTPEESIALKYILYDKYVYKSIFVILIFIIILLLIISQIYKKLKINDFNMFNFKKYNTTNS